MLMLAGFGHALGSETLPWVMKALGMGGILLFATCINTLRLPTSYKLLVLGYSLCVPSILFQSFLGMENCVFAGIVVYMIYMIFHKTPLPEQGSFWVMPSILVIYVLGFLLRPEMLVVMSGFFVALLLQRRLSLAAITLLAIGLSYFIIYWIEQVSNVPLYGAGFVRAILSRTEAVSINLFGCSLFINKKPIYYFVSTFLFLLSYLLSSRSVE
jgi:hypothetical protein